MKRRLFCFESYELARERAVRAYNRRENSITFLLVVLICLGLWALLHELEIYLGR